jgi:pyruvate-formate lyase-activating enzyme
MSSKTTGPVYVAIETINTCNARCPFCPLFQGDSMMSRDKRPAKIMEQKLFGKLIDEIATWEDPPKVIYLNMNGEPLQDPMIADRLEVIKENGLGPLVDIQTNGQYLDEDIARTIIDAAVGRITLGFDGATKEVYEAHRVRCNYERVLGNIRSFAAMRDQLKAPTCIAIQYVRTKMNEAEVSPAHEMFSHFLDANRDVFQDNLSKDWGDKPSSNGLFIMPKAKSHGKPCGCKLFAEQLIVLSDGLVAACCWDYSLSVSAGGLGDANENSLLDIWNGEKRGSLSQSLATDRLDDKPSKCTSCIFLYKTEVAPLSGIKVDPAYTLSTSEYGYTYRFQ